MLCKISHFIRLFSSGFLILSVAQLFAQDPLESTKLQVYTTDLESYFSEFYQAPVGHPELRQGEYKLLCNDLLVIDGFYHREMRQDTWYYFHYNGALYAQGKFVNDRKHGMWEYYSTNGKLSAYGGYVKGQRRGPWQGYYYSGKLAFEGIFLSDSTLSEFSIYHLSGEVAMTRTFEYYDNRVFCHERNFHEKGNQKYELRCELDLRDPYTQEIIRRQGGLEVWLLESSTLTNLNVDDQVWIINGPVKRWYANGMLASHQVFVENDLVGIYGANNMWGTKISACDIFEGNGSWLQFGENQKTRFEAQYSEGKLHGAATVYHDNGNIALKAVFNHGNPDSTWVGYFEDASDRLRLAFFSGDSMYVEQTIFANKALRSGWVCKGYKEGPWVDLNFLSDTIAIRTYEHDFLHGTYAEFNQGVRLKEGEYVYGLRAGPWHSSNMRGQRTWTEYYERNVEGGDLTQPWSAGLQVINPDIFEFEFERVKAGAYANPDLTLHRTPHIEERLFADSSFVMLSLIINPEGELEEVNVVRDVHGKAGIIAESVKVRFPFYRGERFMGIPVRRRYYVETMVTREERYELKE
ncbi:MAG: antitoxin component YwqK of YwqJK toxin-antitoxin module [Flavobacteriales bacterium]|jgi:antitoxin component YwqK of YwqJK toxin-antitoxin module